MQNIDDLLDTIRKRPGMYLGEISLTKLATFLNGYQYALLQLDNKIVGYSEIYPVPFAYFSSYCAHKYNESRSVSCFSILLEQANHNEKEALTYFYDVLDEFRNNVKIQSICKCSLTEENIHYHNTNDSVVKRVVMHEHNFDDTKPIFQNVTVLYCVRLSYLVNVLFSVTDNHIYEAKIFDQPSTSFFGGLDCFVEKNFGKVLWEDILITKNIVINLWNASVSDGW